MPGIGSEPVPMTKNEALGILGLGQDFTRRQVAEAFAAIALESHADKVGNADKSEILGRAIEAKKVLIEYLKGETVEKRAQKLVDRINPYLNEGSDAQKKIVSDLSKKAFDLRNDPALTDDKINKLSLEIDKIMGPIEAALAQEKEDRKAGNHKERDKKQQQKDKEQQDRANSESKQQQSSAQGKEKAEKDNAQKTKDAEQTEEQKAENARKQREFDLYIRRKGFVRTGNKKSHLFEMNDKDAGLCSGLTGVDLNKDMIGKLPDGFYTKTRNWMYKDTNLHVKNGVVSCAPGADENDPKTIRAMLKLSKLQGEPIVFSAKNPKWVTSDQIKAAIKAADGLGSTLNFSALEQHPELGVRDNGVFSNRSQQAEILKLIAKYNLRLRTGKPPEPEEKPTQPDPKTYYKRDSERSPSTEPLAAPRNRKTTGLASGSSFEQQQDDWEKTFGDERRSNGNFNFAYSGSGIASEAHASFEVDADFSEPDLENDFDHEEQTELRPSREESKAEEKDESESDHYVYRKDEEEEIEPSTTNSEYEVDEQFEAEKEEKEQEHRNTMRRR